MRDDGGLSDNDRRTKSGVSFIADLLDDLLLASAAVKRF